MDGGLPGLDVYDDTPPESPSSPDVLTEPTRSCVLEEADDIEFWDNVVSTLNIENSPRGYTLLRNSIAQVVNSPKDVVHIGSRRLHFATGKQGDAKQHERTTVPSFRKTKL